MDQYQWNMALKMPLKVFFNVVALLVTKKAEPCELGLYMAQAMPNTKECAEFQHSHLLC